MGRGTPESLSERQRGKCVRISQQAGWGNSGARTQVVKGSGRGVSRWEIEGNGIVEGEGGPQSRVFQKPGGGAGKVGGGSAGGGIEHSQL